MTATIPRPTMSHAFGLHPTGWSHPLVASTHPRPACGLRENIHVDVIRFLPLLRQWQLRKVSRRNETSPSFDVTVDGRRRLEIEKRRKTAKGLMVES